MLPPNLDTDKCVVCRMGYTVNDLVIWGKKSSHFVCYVKLPLIKFPKQHGKPLIGHSVAFMTVDDYGTELAIEYADELSSRLRGLSTNRNSGGILHEASLRQLDRVEGPLFRRVIKKRGLKASNNCPCLSGLKVKDCHGKKVVQ